MDTPVSDTAPKILENLVAAGLVSHELIGDPARLGTETAALAALCARVAGPVYRLGAFHYAFRAGPGDPGGVHGGDPGAGDPAASLQASLAAELGEEAVWINATDFVADAEAGLDGQGLAFLRAGDGAAAAALVEAPELRAVIHAGLAARAAETAAVLTAEAIDGAVHAAGAGAARVADAMTAVDARLATLDARVEAGSATADAATAALAERLAALEAGIGARVEAAVAVAVAGSVAGSVAEAVGEAVEGAVESAVARAVPGAVAGAVAAGVADAVAGEVVRMVAEAVAETMDGTVGAALREGAAAPGGTLGLGTADPLFERMVGAMEVLVARLGDQAARAAEQSARQDALASGMAALEAAMGALADAEAGREATFAAFENRLGLTLAEFLAQAAGMMPGSPEARAIPGVPEAGTIPEARVVEMAREAPREVCFAGGFRTAQLG